MTTTRYERALAPGRFRFACANLALAAMACGQGSTEPGGAGPYAAFGRAPGDTGPICPACDPVTGGETGDFSPPAPALCSAVRTRLAGDATLPDGRTLAQVAAQLERGFAGEAAASSWYGVDAEPTGFESSGALAVEIRVGDFYRVDRTPLEPENARLCETLYELEAEADVALGEGVLAGTIRGLRGRIENAGSVWLSGESDASGFLGSLDLHLEDWTRRPRSLSASLSAMAFPDQVRGNFDLRVTFDELNSEGELSSLAAWGFAWPTDGCGIDARPVSESDFETPLREARERLSGIMPLDAAWARPESHPRNYGDRPPPTDPGPATGLSIELGSLVGPACESLAPAYDGVVEVHLKTDDGRVDASLEASIGISDTEVEPYRIFLGSGGGSTLAAGDLQRDYGLGAAALSNRPCGRVELISWYEELDAGPSTRGSIELDALGSCDTSGDDDFLLDFLSWRSDDRESRPQPNLRRP